jgi:hypothetical protein
VTDDRELTQENGRRDRNSHAADLISDGCYVAAFRSVFNSAIVEPRRHPQSTGMTAQANEKAFTC